MRGFFCVKAFSKCCLEFICSFENVKKYGCSYGLDAQLFQWSASQSPMANSQKLKLSLLTTC